MKTVPVYHVEYAFRADTSGTKWEPHVIAIRDPSEAEAAAKVRREQPALYACVRVTGPHEHQVPS